MDADTLKQHAQADEEIGSAPSAFGLYPPWRVIKIAFPPKGIL
jgi:hypothetical protein